MPLEINIDTAAFAKIEQKIRDTAEDVLSGGELKREVGEFAVDRLKYQARIGKPFTNVGSFPELMPSSIRHRRYIAKYNTPHATYRDDRSNVTITGEFLESLTWRDEGNCLLQIGFQGMHSIYRGAKGQRISKTIMNETLAKYLSEKGYRVFDNSLQINKQFVSRIKTICLRYIRRALKVRNALAQG